MTKNKQAPNSNAAQDAQVLSESTPKAKKRSRWFSYLRYFALFAFAVIIIGNRFSGSEDGSDAVQEVNGIYETVATLDQVTAANVAAGISRNSRMLVANNVLNQADSLRANLAVATTESDQNVKPTIVTTDSKTAEDVVKYNVVAGDTVTKIAAKFNITTDTIKWANELAGDTVGEGLQLTILPVSGVLHEVAEGDTVSSIARTYQTNTVKIVSFNDAEIDGLEVGKKIVVPDGIQPEPEPAVYIPTGSAALNSTAFSFGGDQPSYSAGNLYGYGYCTWHASNRRTAIGKPIPQNLGNAVTWATLAARAGLPVGEEPRAGAVLVYKDTNIAGGLGHVAYVENMQPDGSALISEMNYQGWNIASTRVIPPSEFGAYLFIY